MAVNDVRRIACPRCGLSLVPMECEVMADSGMSKCVLRPRLQIRFLLCGTAVIAAPYFWRGLVSFNNSRTAKGMIASASNNHRSFHGGSTVLRS